MWCGRLGSSWSTPSHVLPAGAGVALHYDGIGPRTFWEVLMFKLIKLAFYCLIGYALYELYQGFQQTQGGGGGFGGGGRSSREELDRALNSGDEGRAYNLSGP